ncbi:MAG: NUDIX hydrolase [Acidimicrobiales bacterium]
MSGRLTQWLQDHDDVTSPLIPAATVILLRDGALGLETLLLQRSSKLSFAEGSWVFPGGRVDESDRRGPVDDDSAARAAAARECLEEASVTVLEDSLVYYSHWVPPQEAPKRFSTWFFLARSPGETVRVDQGEITGHAWLTPAAALERAHERRIELLAPTWVSLHDLSEFADVEAALNATRTHGPKRFATRIISTPEGPAAAWKPDAGYATGDHSAEGSRHRLVMGPGRWRLERSEHNINETRA